MGGLIADGDLCPSYEGSDDLGVVSAVVACAFVPDVVSDLGDDLSDKSGDFSAGVARGAGDRGRSCGVVTSVGEVPGDCTLP